MRLVASELTDYAADFTPHEIATALGITLDDLATTPNQAIYDAVRADPQLEARLFHRGEIQGAQLSQLTRQPDLQGPDAGDLAAWLTPEQAWHLLPVLIRYLQDRRDTWPKVTTAAVTLACPHCHGTTFHARDVSLRCHDIIIEATPDQPHPFAGFGTLDDIHHDDLGTWCADCLRPVTVPEHLTGSIDFS